MNQAKLMEQLRVVDKALGFVVSKMEKGEIEKTSNFDRLAAVREGSDFALLSVNESATRAEKIEHELKVKGEVLNAVRYEFETDKVFSTAMAYIAVRSALDTLGENLGKKVTITPFAQTKEQNLLNDIQSSAEKLSLADGMEM